MSEPYVHRIELGQSPCARKGFALGLVRCSVLLAGVVLALLHLPLALLVFAGLSLLWLPQTVQCARRLRASRSPATLTADGITLRIDDRVTRIPWKEVGAVRVYTQRGRVFPLTTSLGAWLTTDSHHKQDPLVAEFQRVLPKPLGQSDRAIWLGEITKADKQMDVVLTAVRHWVDGRLDSTPYRRAVM